MITCAEGRGELEDHISILTWLNRTERANWRGPGCQIYLFFFAINFLQDYSQHPQSIIQSSTSNKEYSPEMYI